MAGNNACMEVLFEATLRQPRGDPHKFGPWLNISVKCRLFAHLLGASAVLVSHLVPILIVDLE